MVALTKPADTLPGIDEMSLDDHNESTRNLHTSVLLNEVIEYLQPSPEGLYVDATLGLGGHTRAILDRSAPEGRVLGLEWDPNALKIAQEQLQAYDSRITIVRANYATLSDVLTSENIDKIDGLVIDLGVSSIQLDSRGRGFSFRFDDPLDMRMDDRTEKTAADLLQNLSKDELADVFFHYGEERQARRIADWITREQEESRIETTAQLADVVSRAIPKKYHPKKIHVATKVFQALRIAVNRELDNLNRILEEAPRILKPGARFCAITFHSLEDRMVKKAFTANPGYRVITKRPVVPREEEITRNPRARSAKLRVAAAL